MRGIFFKPASLLLVLIAFAIMPFSASHAQWSIGAFWKTVAAGGGGGGPPNPTGLSATPSEFSVQLSWTSGGGSTAGFVVVWAASGTAPADCAAATTSERETGISSSPYTVDGLLPGTQYSFRLCAIDGSSVLSSGATVTTTTTSNDRYIFTTDGTYKGNAIPTCSTLASAASLPNSANYQMFLGGGGAGPIILLGGVKMPLKNRRPAGSGGPQIAVTSRLLTTLTQSIGYSQTNTAVAGNAWTGTDTFGASSTSHCTTWTSGAGGQSGTIGLPTDTASATWFSTGTTTCGTSNRVICVDTTNGTIPPADPISISFTATSGTTGTLSWSNPTAEIISSSYYIYATGATLPGVCLSNGSETTSGVDLSTTSASVSGLTAGITYNVWVCSKDEDNLVSNGKLYSFTMPASTILWISSLGTSGVSSTGFTASVSYTGDSDNDYGATLYYCNATLNAGCDPQTGGTGYGSISMSKSGGSITATVSGLAPSTWNEYDVLNIRVVATDPDGVNGSPLNGTVTLLNVVQPPSSWGSTKVRIKSTDGSGNYNYGITNDSDYFGRMFAAKGRIMVAGAQLDDNSSTTFPTGAEANDSATDSGAAYILRDTSAGGDWSSYVIDAYLKEGTPTANAIFGTAVAFDGTTMAISAPSQSTSLAGKVYIYRETSANNNWSDVALKDTITDPKFSAGTTDAFGYALAVSGRNLFVGDYNDDGKDETPGSEVATQILDSGAVCVYYDATGDGTGYPASTPDKKLKQRDNSNALNVVTKMQFGKSIDYSDSTLIVGAPGQSGFGVSGKAFVYSCTVTATSAACGPTINWSAGTNTITAKVLTTTSPFNVPDTSATSEQGYGHSVSIDDDAAVVGAPYDRGPNESDNSGTAITDSGTAYVWRSANGNHNWSSYSMIKKLKMRNTGGTVAPVANYTFGVSVGIRGPVIAVGAARPASTNQPQVNVFKDSDGDADYSTGSLNHHETVQAPYNWVSGQSDRFGEWIYLDNSPGVFHLFIGSFLESSTSTVLATDTNPGSGTGYQSGSIFVYGP